MRSWKEEDISHMLDVAEDALRDSCKRMRLDVQFLRKTRAIGDSCEISVSVSVISVSVSASVCASMSSFFERHVPSVIRVCVCVCVCVYLDIDIDRLID